MPYKDVEARRASNRRSYEKHKTRWNATFRKTYRDNHKEEHAEYASQYRKDNKDKINEHSRNRRATDPEHRQTLIGYGKKWRKENPERQAVSQKKYRLKEYGLTVEEYEAMAERQHYRCLVCGEKRPLYRIDNKSSNGLCIDHDHKTGKVRGLLCDTCNRGIGLLKDAPHVLRAAADYLEQHD